jgi:spermidine synthase
LASQEFFRVVRSKLTSRGLLVLNVLVHDRRIYASIVKTLGSVFPQVSRMPLGRFGSRNSLLLASARPDLKIDRGDLQRKARQIEARFGVRFGLDRCVAALGADQVSTTSAPLIRDPPGPGSPR